MIDALSTGLAGVVFGLAIAAPPGPVNAVIAEESVFRGWIAGVLAGLGAMTADAAFFVLALVGVVAVVERFPTLRAVMVGAGGLLMLYFAYGAAREAGASFHPARETADDGTEPVRRPESRGFRKTLVLALVNPYQILFWLTIGVGLLRPGRVDVLGQTPYVGDSLVGLLVVQTGTPALVLGFFGGILAWVLAFPGTLVLAERRVDSFATVVAGLSALVLAGFGLVFLSDAVGTLV